MDGRAHALSRSLVVIGVLIQFLLIPRTFATVSSTACTNGVPFLIHGDWGTPGENQTKIADQMNSWSLQNQAMFLVALGDNFYCTMKEAIAF